MSRPRRLSGTKVLSVLTCFTVFSFATHKLGLIFLMVVIDLCTLAGWYA